MKRLLARLPFARLAAGGVPLILSLLAPVSAWAAEDDPGGSASDPRIRSDEDRPVDWDKLPPGVSPKRWGLSSTLEVHRLIRQDDLGGAAKNKALNYYSLDSYFDITARDRVEFKWGMFQRFISDNQETGARLDDMLLRYVRYIPLPWELDLRVKGSFTIPTSFESKLAGIVTEPRVGFNLDRRFGDLSVGTAFRTGPTFVTKRTSDGGSANPKWTVRAGIYAEYRMPFHKPLSVGATVQTDYYWMRDPEKTSGDPTLAQFDQGGIKPVADTNHPDPPVEQTYGGEVYVSYNLPQIWELSSNLRLALAQGDPTLGYPNAIHDGRQNAYWFFRRNGQVYLAFTLGY
jgi:hypothetical protein